MPARTPHDPEFYAKTLALTEKVNKRAQAELINSLKPALRCWMATAEESGMPEGVEMGLSLSQIMGHSSEFDDSLIDGYLLEEVANSLVDDGEWRRQPHTKYQYIWNRDPEWVKRHAA